MHVAALTGPSGSGKTTIIEELIRRFVSAGRTVGAIKHTHHPLNAEDRGDTRRFREAGANPVVLAGDGEAIIFERHGPHPALRATLSRKRERELIAFGSPSELLAHFATDILLIEGFKSFAGWPRVEMTPDLTAEDVARILDRIWRP